MPSALIRKVADYCWSNNFLDVFHKYFADHAEAFIDAPEICGGEHNMQYYALFQDYLKVYEDTLTSFVSSIDVSIEEFYAEVRETQEESMDPYLRVFVDCLLASADYESFYKVMVREGKKKALALKRAEKAKLADAKTTEDATADAKQPAGAGTDDKTAADGKVTDTGSSASSGSPDAKGAQGDAAEAKGGESKVDLDSVDSKMADSKLGGDDK